MKIRGTALEMRKGRGDGEMPEMKCNADWGCQTGETHKLALSNGMLVRNQSTILAILITL